jgi:hypothetical protein
LNSFPGFHLTVCNPIGPRLRETTCPHAAWLPLGLGLRRCVAAFAILGPVEREAVSHKPISNIRPTDGADRYRALVSVAIYLDTVDGATINQVKQRIRCFLPAAVVVAVRIVANLIGFGRIDSENPNADAVNLDGVSVDNRYLADQFVSGRCAADGEKNGANKCSHFGRHTLSRPRGPAASDRVIASPFI